jgi:hypothetical protein
MLLRCCFGPGVPGDIVSRRGQVLAVDLEDASAAQRLVAAQREKSVSQRWLILRPL